MNNKAQLKIIIALLGFLILIIPVILLLGGVLLSGGATGDFVLTGGAVEDAELYGYSKITNCSEGVIEIIDEPASMGDVGRGVFKVAICNYNKDELMEPLLDAYISNYNTFVGELVQNCTKLFTIPAGSYRDYECEIPLYKDCFGHFHLHYSTYKGDVKTEVGEARQVHILESETMQYCAKEPHNTGVSILSFNNDVNNPVINAVITNHFGTADVEYYVGGSVEGCADVGYEGVCKFCKSAISNFAENTQTTVECPLFKRIVIDVADGNDCVVECVNSGYLTGEEGAAEDTCSCESDYPYSIIPKIGTLGASVIDINNPSEDYSADNTATSLVDYSFEFINISLEQDSLRIETDEYEYYGIYSFTIANKGDFTKSVDFTITGQYLEHVTDSSAEGFEVCAGSITVGSGETEDVSCNLKNKNGKDYAVISCDTTDDCQYDEAMITTLVEISVESQEAEVFKQFEKIEDTSNLFILPVYYDLTVEPLQTPTRS